MQRLKRVARLTAVLAALSAPGAPAVAGGGIMDTQSAPIANPVAARSYGITEGSLVPAPIPFSNPTIGSGLVLGLGYLFQTDTGSDPTVLGFGAMASDNGSRAYGISINLALSNNRWLADLFFGRMDLNYDLYTSLGRLPIGQQGTLGRLALSYGVTPDLSFGATLRYLDTSIDQKLVSLPSPFDLDLAMELLNVGMVADWDTRDDTIYPTDGHRLYGEFFHGRQIGGIGHRSYLKGYVNFDLYRPVGEHGVLAARVSTCAADDGAPFFDKCALGMNDGFRGFSVTQFLDNRAASAQVEYRHRFGTRIGGVLFAGAGTVGPHYKDFGFGGLHGAAGLGLRYRVSKKFPVDFAVDGSRNSLGENTLYISVGQRF